MKITLALIAALLLAPLASLNAASPETGSSAEVDETLSWTFTPDPALPNVLILGDSISIGYTLQVRALLKDKANVFRAMTPDGKRRMNCNGTTDGVANVDQWLAGHRWSVIHFNWGLHDLKHVKAAGTNDKSNDPNDPVQATVDVYRRNLEAITAKLKATGARLIFATTTPVAPGTLNPLRDPDAPRRYNATALEIMKTSGIRVNDLFAFCEPQLDKLQLPKNVHFKKEGSEALAKQVAAAIREELAARTSPHAADARDKPNIVYILADDLGYMDVGAYNPKTFYETPNIDSLANRGMKFTQGYAACCVCSPTRGSIMTGKYPPRFGITNFIGGSRAGKLLPAANADRLPLEETTIAEALRDAGYATFFAGKWHLGGDEFYPGAQGFSKELDNGNGKKSNAQFWYPVSELPVPDHQDDPKTTDRIVNEAVEFIGEHKDQPFFAYLPFLAVHTPIGARAELVAKYEKKAESAPADAWGQEGGNKVRLVQNHAKYAAMLEQLDAGIGRVIEALETNGLSEKTIVVFMSDNGGLSTSEGWPTSNLPLRGGKGWPYEGGVREPMIVVAPGLTKPGTICDAPVISTDFYPTLLQLAGLPLKPAQHLDGVSFLPLLRGDTTPRGKALYWHYPHYSNQGGAPHGAIRDGDWKLIEWYEDGALELYNIPQDIGEKNNLAEQEPDHANALHEKLIAWRNEVGALMPTPNTGPAKSRKKKAK